MGIHGWIDMVTLTRNTFGFPMGKNCARGTAYRERDKKRRALVPVVFVFGRKGFSHGMKNISILLGVCDGAGRAL